MHITMYLCTLYSLSPYEFSQYLLLLVLHHPNYTLTIHFCDMIINKRTLVCHWKRPNCVSEQKGLFFCTIGNVWVSLKTKIIAVMEKRPFGY